ncbi:MAG: D-alanyl-D-alanine carboxypeptidase [Treponema sp.]|nr:D-alanyl-D-alanine carboxypeptidase [Treponema sp.]
MSDLVDMNKTEKSKKNLLKDITPVQKILFGTASGILVLLIVFFILTGVRASKFGKLTEAVPLTEIQAQELDSYVRNTYPERFQYLKSLPYNLANPELNVGAVSAILVDVSNGNVIYEKKADKRIPPASMTKLFTMYIVDEEVSAGRLHYEDVIPLPPESWACNMPPHSSLMFLGKGQVVTLEELLLGLSICSGNDAAYAIAYTVSGNMESFVEKMNQVARDLGLEYTHFVEASGYSEDNITTAREMATFCRVYLQRHPDSLARFHSVPSFTYPKAQNMAPGDKYGPQDFSKGLPEHITMGITQDNTNPLLGKMEGCDGLKTGYIDESGYNLALTAMRNGTRFLAVTLGGRGSNSREGQANRVKDGTELMDFAFGSFADMRKPEELKPYFVKVYGAQEMAVNLIPAFDIETVLVPYVTGNSIAENISQVQVYLDLPETLHGEIVQGQTYGTVKIMLTNYVLDEIPLVADRSIKKAHGLRALIDSMLD